MIQLQHCLRNPIPETWKVRDLLLEARIMHLDGDYREASIRLSESNSNELRAWTESILGAKSPYVNPKKILGAPPKLRPEERIGDRMPDTATKKKIIERDGYHCVFCGIPVIAPETRKKWHKLYPDAIPWGKRNSERHAAFFTMWLQFDHVLPHSRGGTNDLDNMIVTCAPCNFGKMEWTLEELGLEDPRGLARVESEWDGLGLRQN